MVRVDKSELAVASNGVYVLDLDGSIQLWRLQRLPGKEIEASSANPAYSLFRFGMEDSGVSVIGRVVWVGGRCRGDSSDGISQCRALSWNFLMS